MSDRTEMASRIATLEEEKNGAYSERNKLVALLASLFPSSLCQTDIPGWEEDWHWCVFIETDAGQMSWHIHDSEVKNFSHVHRRVVQWDGHSTAEKYARVSSLIAQSGKENDV